MKLLCIALAAFILLNNVIISSSCCLRNGHCNLKRRNDWDWDNGRHCGNSQHWDRSKRHHYGDDCHDGGWRKDSCW
ncbi:hypothetical protein FQR65_LT11446 [Abscondita terminalis]|nr:hypothetical protein FQR65_LT11446 [Abscondita terminalis]